MSNSPFLEIIICTYNNATLLEGALGAIAQQKVSQDIDWGVLVVNNNCTDQTVAVVEEKSQHLPNLRMVFEPIQGLTPARLRGIKETSAAWVAFVDDDCFLRSDWVTEAVQFALNHPNCGAFGGRVTLDWESPPPQYVMNFKYCFAEQELGSERKQVSWLVGAGIVINRSALEAVGWTEQQCLADRVGKTLISGGDMEIAVRLSAKYDLWYVPSCQLFHQISTQRLSYDYLLKINYRLGISQLFVQSLQWQNSYLSWLFASLKEGWGLTSYATKLLLEGTLKGQSLKEHWMTFRFACGYWVGIWQLMQMESPKRQQILGRTHI